MENREWRSRLRRAVPTITNRKIPHSWYCRKRASILPLHPIIDNKISMTDTGTYYLPFGKHNSLTPLHGSVTPLRGSVTSLRGSVTSLRGSVTPLKDAVTPLRGSVTPLKDAVTSLKDAVTPLRGAVTSPGSADILAIILKNRIL